MVLIGPQLPPNGLSKLVASDVEPNITVDPGQVTLQQPQLYAEPRGWPHSVGCGLKNLGNSCYLNSTLQCLTHLPPFANVCLGKDHSATCPANGASCTACILERQVVSALQKGKDSYSIQPREVWNCLNLFSRSFRQGRQEDAHELLRCMAEALERDMLKAEGRWTPGKPVKNAGTLVNRIFQGCLQSQVRCLACKHESNTYDPFMDLSLELLGSNSVREALTRFTRPERLDGDNRYRCEKCKQLVAAEKRLTLYDEPNALVVHLKRFDVFSAIGKISRHVAFEERMSLEPFMAPNRPVLKGLSGAPAYTLHGVVVHQGASVQSGHYYAYVRDTRTNQWFCMNDSDVYPVSLERVRSESVYMLFYTRQRMKPLRQLPGSTDGQAASHPNAAPAGPSVQNEPDDDMFRDENRHAAGPSLAHARSGAGNGAPVYGPLPRSSSGTTTTSVNGAAVYGPQPLARSNSGTANGAVNSSSTNNNNTNGAAVYGPQPLARSNSGMANGSVNNNNNNTVVSGAAVYGPQPLARSNSGMANGSVNNNTVSGAAVYGPQPLTRSNSGMPNGSLHGPQPLGQGSGHTENGTAAYGTQPLARSGSGFTNGEAHGPQPLAQNSNVMNGTSIHASQQLPRSSSGVSNGTAAHGGPMAGSSSDVGNQSRSQHQPHVSSAGFNGAPGNAHAGSSSTSTSNGLLDTRNGVKANLGSGSMLSSHTPISFSLGGSGASGLHASHLSGGGVTRISAPPGGVVRSSSLLVHKSGEPSGRTNGNGTAAAAMNGSTWGTVRRASDDGGSVDAQHHGPQPPSAPPPGQSNGGPKPVHSTGTGPTSMGSMQAPGSQHQHIHSSTGPGQQLPGDAWQASHGKPMSSRPGVEVTTLKFPVAAATRPSASTAPSPHAPAHGMANRDMHTQQLSSMAWHPQSTVHACAPAAANGEVHMHPEGMGSAAGAPQQAVSGRKRSRRELEAEMQSTKLGEAFQGALKHLKGGIKSLLRSDGWDEAVRRAIQRCKDYGDTYEDVMAHKAEQLRILREGIAAKTKEQCLAQTAALFKDALP